MNTQYDKLSDTTINTQLEICLENFIENPENYFNIENRIISHILILYRNISGDLLQKDDDVDHIIGLFGGQIEDILFEYLEWRLLKDDAVRELRNIANLFHRKNGVFSWKLH